MAARAGRLSERITITRASEADDGAGEPVLTWADLATVWAGVVETTPRAVMAAGVVDVDAPLTRFEIRNDGDAAGVTAADRLVWVTNANLAMRIVEVSRAGARPLYLTIAAREIEPGEA